MMNKKLLLAFTVTLLLTACGGKKDDYVYVGPNFIDVEIFDYEKSSTLEDGLANIFTISEQPMSEQTFSSFMSIISSNDYYANRVVSTRRNQILYPNPNDANNINSRRDGDINYQIVDTFTRNNTNYSISGTSVIHDEKWVTNTLDPAVLGHTSVNTNGTYSLHISTDSETYLETFDYDSDLYDSSKETGYDNYQYFYKTNLTNSSDIANHLTSTIEYVDSENELLASENQFEVSFTASRNGTSFEVAYQATSSRTTVGSDILEVSYYIDIQIAGGMIVSTTYLYTEIEKGASDFLLKKVEDSRQYSVV